MVDVIYKKGKKNIIIDGREYGAISLYFHIKRNILILKRLKERGEWDEERQMEHKAYIERYLKAFKDNFDDEAIWWWIISYSKSEQEIVQVSKDTWLTFTSIFRKRPLIN